MSTSGSVDRLFIRLMSLSLSSTRCRACSRMPIKQHYVHDRFGGTSKRSTSLLHPSVTGPRSPFLLRSYSTSSTSTSTLPKTLSRTQQTTTVNHDPDPRQRDATTSIAMIHCAKRNDPDQCLQHYLKLVRTQGKLPSHHALHDLALVLYRNQHLSGFSILHDTLFAYYTLHPLSARQSRNLTYFYTMLINLIIQKPNGINKRPSPFTEKNQYTPHVPPPSTPSTSKGIPTSSICHMSSTSVLNSHSSSPQTISMDDVSSPPPPPPTASSSSDMMEKTATIIQLCQEMRQLGLPTTPVFYNSILKFCVTKKDPDLAWNFYNEMTSACTPTKETFSILLDLNRQQRNPKGTLVVLDEMDKYGILPDRVMTSTVMLNLCDHHLYTEAADFLDQLAYQCPHIMGPIYKSVLMKTLHRHYCKYGPHYPTTSTTKTTERQQRRYDNRKNKRKQAYLDSVQPQP